MKCIVLEPLAVSNEKLVQLLTKATNNNVEIITYPDRKEDVETLIDRSKDADILVLSNIKLQQEVLQHCHNLKFICVAFTGYDHIDLNYCKDHGIKVSNCAGYSTCAVADLVFGFIIAIYRNIIKANALVRENGTKAGLLGPELEGKKFGIVGLGAIGQRVAKIANAFGCEVYGTSKTKKEIAGVTYTDLDTLLKTCDIVSLHLPCNENTKGLISKEKIALMKKDAILINTARGPIVDSNALAQALNNDKLAGAGIDVFENEPPINENHPLLNAKNCICTPHIGFFSTQAMEKRAVIVADNIEHYLNNNQINIII